MSDIRSSRGKMRVYTALGTMRVSDALPGTGCPAHWISTVAYLAAHIGRVLTEWRARVVQRRALAMLDDHFLKDIGVSPADVEWEISKPFWRA